MDKKLNVAFYVYPTAFQSPGGGEVQLLKTKEYLEREGVTVKLFDTWSDKLRNFDILHTFGSVKDCLPMIRLAHTLGVRTALSTICWYSWRSAWGTYGSPQERSLALLRHTGKSFFPFISSQRKEMIRLSDILFPNSESEAKQLERYFGVSRKKIFIVPNGVDSSFAQAKPEIFIKKYHLEDFILCVGRIEPRKNQLNMVRALKGSEIPVVFIGDYVPQYKKYYDLCRQEASQNMHFLGSISHDSGLLASAYAACHTFLLASWLETPGLAALEAALAGARVVITNQGAAPEYFLQYASYVSPFDLSDIRTQTLKTFDAPKDSGLKGHILKNYLWENVAKKTLAGYEELLKS